MGQLRIAIETIYATNHNPISDGMALHAIRLLAENLPRCHELDLERLLLIKTAASMASLGNTGGLGLNTAMAHHVGGIFDVPHGEANSITLPHTMRYNAEACADRLAMIADAMGIDVSGMTDDDAAFAAADWVENLSRILGLPARRRDVGVPEEGAGTDSLCHLARPCPCHQPEAGGRCRADHDGAQAGVVNARSLGIVDRWLE